ncbi:MAG: hypothetical protein II567_14765 [Candidatus Riflebacteria bacterium]|nr:hypothetical protein [Candidatus Riflebacteria bacterium]
MKSKKKKNKQNILIAYNKGIASIQGIELAMLFCHAGFSVKTILFDNAEEYISRELLKEVTEHAPWSNSHKPSWVKAEIEYPVGIIFDEKIPLDPPLTKGVKEGTSENNDSNNGIATPLIACSNQTPQSLCDSSPTIRGGASDSFTAKFVEYINKHCKTIKILQKKGLAEPSSANDVNKQIIEIPHNPLKLRSLFEKILSEVVVLASSKALDGKITYNFEGDFSNIDYVKDLEKAFADAGIDANDEIAMTLTAVGSQPLHSLASPNPASPPFVGQHLHDSSPNSLDFEDASCSCVKREVSKVIISNEKKQIEVVLEADETEIKPTKNRIYVSKHKNGLLLIDSIETRLLPQFSSQSCYSRLVTYLKVSLERKNRGNDK